MVEYNFGKNIRDIRLGKKMTQVQLACKVEVASVYISAIEFNKAVPSLKTLKKIAEALEVDITELFK